ncbi:hypothetical protein CC86DRAFT_350551 [Ophiobolus disseminans]|uniref:Integral membrane protein n=1 Tax=Ophiobolus disseminans TaxID=1469910 RepID=A0A6A6ZYH1_9PLEO|nr:hypothetical protein CC86DRAFT_350551 [Ophiobolus disseminans]
MGISRHPALPYISSLFGCIFLFFGVTYISNPVQGFSFLGFTSTPTTPYDWDLMQRVMVLYGAKDLFMAAAILSSTWFGTRKSAGMVLVAGGLCAGVDGWVVGDQAGTGEWGHWGYGMVMVGVGAGMMGVLG